MKMKKSDLNMKTSDLDNFYGDLSTLGDGTFTKKRNGMTTAKVKEWLARLGGDYTPYSFGSELPQGYNGTIYNNNMFHPFSRTHAQHTLFFTLCGILAHDKVLRGCCCSCGAYYNWS